MEWVSRKLLYINAFYGSLRPGEEVKTIRSRNFSGDRFQFEIPPHGILFNTQLILEVPEGEDIPTLHSDGVQVQYTAIELQKIAPDDIEFDRISPTRVVMHIPFFWNGTKLGIPAILLNSYIQITVYFEKSQNLKIYCRYKKSHVSVYPAEEYLLCHRRPILYPEQIIFQRDGLFKIYDDLRELHSIYYNEIVRPIFDGWIGAEPPPAPYRGYIVPKSPDKPEITHHQELTNQVTAGPLSVAYREAKRRFQSIASCNVVDDYEPIQQRDD